MRTRLALLVISALARTAPAEPEVCPLLSSMTPETAYWEGEELWPLCPVASPVLVTGGRCTEGARCMQPCASTVEGPRGSARYAYTYDPSGRFLAMTGNDGVTDVFERCERDAGGHVTKCETKLGTHEYTYQHGRLASAKIFNDTRTYDYDRKGRLARERWRGKYHDMSISYTYAADGTLAKYTTLEAGKPEAVAFTYDHGRRTATTSQAGTTTYSYDERGRVLEEIDREGTYEVKTTYAYDDHGRLVEEIRDSPRGKETTRYRYACK